MSVYCQLKKYQWICNEQNRMKRELINEMEQFLMDNSNNNYFEVNLKQKGKHITVINYLNNYLPTQLINQFSKKFNIQYTGCTQHITIDYKTNKHITKIIYLFETKK